MAELCHCGFDRSNTHKRKHRGWLSPFKSFVSCDLVDIFTYFLSRTHKGSFKTSSANLCSKVCRNCKHKYEINVEVQVTGRCQRARLEARHGTAAIFPKIYAQVYQLKI